jgi:ketosteroid isomerase-like protein
MQPGNGPVIIALPMLEGTWMRVFAEARIAKAHYSPAPVSHPGSATRGRLLPGREMLNDNLIAPALIALVLMAPPVRSAAETGAEEAIRSTLGQWTQAFNAGKADVVCSLFSPKLRYDFRGYPERDYRDICDRLNHSLADKSKTYAYALDIREILVSGNLAVVRLVWTLTVTLPNGQRVTSVEPGMDVLRRDSDGAWKIIRYLAYEAPERSGAKGP